MPRAQSPLSEAAAVVVTGLTPATIVVRHLPALFALLEHVIRCRSVARTGLNHLGAGPRPGVGGREARGTELDALVAVLRQRV